MVAKWQKNFQVLRRTLSASYGVSTQKALSEKLCIPSNNVSAWVQRNSVSGNAIVQRVLDTGADIHWSVSGEFANANTQWLKTFRKDRVLSEHPDAESVDAAVSLYNPDDYSHLCPTSRPRKLQTEICFTGFKKGYKERLISIAVDNDMAVKSSVTKVCTPFAADLMLVQPK